MQTEKRVWYVANDDDVHDILLKIAGYGVLSTKRHPSGGFGKFWQLSQAERDRLEVEINFVNRSRRSNKRPSIILEFFSATAHGRLVQDSLVRLASRRAKQLHA